ncbi:MAG: hypothetical protein IJ789_00320 [Bacteroidales bacterium]|nr:hypothetical protein [Bacteroidales bacterium]
MELPRHLTLLIALTVSLLPIGAKAQEGLYSLFANQPEVRVAQVDNFQLDSNTAVGVLLLEATSDHGWRQLRRQLAIGDLAPEQQRDLMAGTDIVLFAQRNRLDPSQPPPLDGENLDPSGSCYLGISYLSRTILIFTPSTPEQTEAVVATLMRKMLRSPRP